MYMIDFATGIATKLIAVQSISNPYEITVIETQLKEQMVIRDGKVFAFGVELTENNTIIL